MHEQGREHTTTTTAAPAANGDHGAASRGSGRTLVAALTVVVGLFIGSSLYVSFSAESIDQAASSITENAAPSIAQLSAARAELQAVQHELDEYLAAATQPGRMPTADALRGERARLDDELRIYRHLPMFPGEQPMARRMERERVALDAATERIIDAVQHGRPGEARAVADGAVREAGIRLRILMIQLTELNAWHARDLAHTVTVRRRHAAHTALVLDTLSVALAALAALLARRSIARNEALLEANRRAADARAAEFEAFAGRVAHDVRSPLSPVSLALDLCERRTGDDARVREAVHRARRGLARVTTTVDGLLEFAHAGAQSPPDARAEIDPVIDGLIEEVTPDAAAAGIELAVEARAHGAVTTSAGVLTSAVGNLLRNAIKYIGHGAVKRVTVRVRDVGPRARIEVEDTGPGVPPALRAAVFEPHVRAPGVTQSGFGLGLATVKRVAEAHRGAVGCEPGRGGVGSVFWIELPWARASDPPAPAPPADATGARAALRGGGARAALRAVPPDEVTNKERER